MTAIIGAWVKGDFHLVADLATQMGQVTTLGPSKLHITPERVMAFSGDCGAISALLESYGSSLPMNPSTALYASSRCPSEQYGDGLVFSIEEGTCYYVSSNGELWEACLHKPYYMACGCASEVILGHQGLYPFSHPADIDSAMRKAHTLMPGAVSKEVTRWSTKTR